jgi:hypothetical protein
VKKPVVTPDGSVATGKPSIGQMLSGCQETWAMLTDDVWDDGTPRVRSTLMILADGSTVKLWLNDKASGRACWISGESLDDALCSLEAGLYAGSLPWRAQAPTNSKKR